MDAFLNSFHDLCITLLPILGAIALFILIVLFIRLIKVLKSVERTVDKLPSTVDLVDISLQKAQAPLDTVVRVSNTLDDIHDKTVEGVEKVKEFVVKNYEDVKEKITGKKKSDSDELKEPSPEDLIGR